MNEPSEAAACSPPFVETMDEYERCCQKNIRQHTERIEHRIEADPKVILAMIAKIKEQESRITELDDNLSVTIGALRRSSESAVALKGLLSKVARVWSYAAVSVNGGLWQEIQDVLRDDSDGDDLAEARTIILRTDIRFTCGTTTFDCMAGKVAFLRQRDERNRKVLLDFGGRMVDWFHESILEYFDMCQQNMS